MRFHMILTACMLAAPSYALDVEITLVDQLDGQQNSYCLDIVGGGRNIDPANGLQAHTCYSYRGALGRDQVFDSAQFGENTLYMPRFDVCVEARSLSEGANLGLAECTDGPLQSFALEQDGTLRPVSANHLCFTAGEETRLGNNPIHQIKSLTLANCSEGLAPYQTWRFRSEDD